MGAKKAHSLFEHGTKKKERKNADGCEHIRTKWKKNHSKTVVLIKMGKSESAQHSKQSRRERIFMWISAIFIDPSSIQISGWEMPMLTIIHIRFVSSLFTWFGCCVCVCVCVRFFLCFYTFHCILFTFYIENTRANTLFARYQRSERVRKRENIISDAMRWYQYLLSSFSGVFLFPFCGNTFQCADVNLCHCYYLESN